MKPSMKLLCAGHRPSYANERAAGLDLRAMCDAPVSIEPGKRVKLNTGVRAEIPSGFFGMVAIRSGLGFRGLILSNGIGVIDEDYRGEIAMSVTNLGEETITIEDGERVAQMILVPYTQAEIEFADELEETSRGEGGFGSSGRF